MGLFARKVVRAASLSLALFASAARLCAATLENLRVEYTAQPLGIDVAQPRFSWQMRAADGVRGEAQSAYRIEVTDLHGAKVWDSARITDAHALGITYTGAPLQPTTRYRWRVTVWDRNDKPLTADSWFETGLLDPTLAAWEGATWIGAGPEDLVLSAHYLPTFGLRFTVALAPGSNRAGFILAANDPRLMDRNKNVFQLQSRRNESYFKLELDLTGLARGENGRAQLHVYRAGYAPGDDPARPVQSFELPPEVVNTSNQHAEHTIAIRAENGQLGISVDGVLLLRTPEEPGWAPGRGWASVSLNPLGKGHDYVTLGMLGEIGFALPPGQQARFARLEVFHLRSPRNVLFRENLSASAYTGIFRSFAADPASGLRVAADGYHVTGGAQGTLLTADPSRHAMPLLRAAFTTPDRRVASARLYVTARGIYEVFLNGKRVGDDHYNPGLTQYNRTHLYQTYDVTPLVSTGPNVLGAMLGEGWWSGQLSYGGVWNHFGDRQSLLAKLVVTYDDGSRQIVTTNDRDWEVYTDGPLRYGSLNMGEIYDATREAAVRGWDAPGFDARAWQRAIAVPLAGSAYDGADLPFDGLKLVGQIGATAGVFKVLPAQSLHEVRPGVYIYDLGQNIVGVPRIVFRDGQSGRRVTLRYAEVLYPDLPESRGNVGLLMTENLRAALSQDLYVQRDGEQVYQPRFTSHGFRYIEISGVAKPPALDAVQGVVISSIRALTAGYESSNPRVNQLWSNLVWSNVDNFLTVPTDCPQRNERMGWSGDVSVFAPTATYVSDASQFLRRHLQAMRDVQAPSGRFTDIAPVGGGFGGLLWGSAGIIVPWECYLQYGDTALLAEHYAAMAAYVRYIETTLDPRTGLSTDAQLGDWLGPQNDQLSPTFLAAAYHVYTLEIMARVAELLQKATDAAAFRQRHAEQKAFFNRTFLDAERRAISPRGDAAFRLSDTQTAYAVGLALEAFDAAHRPSLTAHLAAAVERENRDDSGATRPKYSLMTGFIGTAWISRALSDAGRSDLAYRQLQNRAYPSWLYAVDQGATTIWERLNGYTVEHGFGGNNGMNSFNHYSFGAVGQWLIGTSLGIARDEPGFRRFALRPEPDPTGEMTWARGHYDSAYGRIESGWQVENATLSYTATVPANTMATLHLPTRSPDTVQEGGRPAGSAPGVRFITYQDGKALYELQSGRYEFTCTR